MLNGQKIIVVMPAYNAARTLRKTYDEVMAQQIVDLIIVVDDASQDETVAIAHTLDRVHVEVHPTLPARAGGRRGHCRHDSS
jgi:glycosyltransferase involved in cell wall biosynthesis